MADVVGIGSTFIDYFFETDKNFLAKYDLKPEDDYLFSDKKISFRQVLSQLKPLAKSPGGISSNTIAVLAHLGISCSYTGVIGKDREGDFWLKNIGKIDKSRVLRIGKTSLCASLLTNNRKNRTFLSEVNSKESTFLKNIDYSFYNKSKIIHVGPFIADAKKGIEVTQKFLEKVSGPLISFSPGIIYIAQGEKALRDILKMTDVLFLNRKEMKYLKPGSPEKSSKKLLKFGIRIIVCTLGEKGAIVTSATEQFYISRVNVKNIVDTTGAGDAFAAGFLHGVLNKKSLKWSGQFAAKTAARSMQNLGLAWIKQDDTHN
ncbi:MAG: PfkB family carbohydrate kinase [Candidatus Curtissbacteria bacterium]